MALSGNVEMPLKGHETIDSLVFVELAHRRLGMSRCLRPMKHDSIIQKGSQSRSMTMIVVRKTIFSESLHRRRHFGDSCTRLETVEFPESMAANIRRHRRAKSAQRYLRRLQTWVPKLQSSWSMSPRREIEQKCFSQKGTLLEMTKSSEKQEQEYPGATAENARLLAYSMPIA